MRDTTGTGRDWRDPVCVCVGGGIGEWGIGEMEGGELRNRKSFLYPQPIWEIQCTEADTLVNIDSLGITHAECFLLIENCYFFPDNNFIDNKMKQAVWGCGFAAKRQLNVSSM
jgi:hypothetical protein